MKTTWHKDQTVTYWSVLRQQWIRRAEHVPAEELATWPAGDRQRWFARQQRIPTIGSLKHVAARLCKRRGHRMTWSRVQETTSIVAGSSNGALASSVPSCEVDGRCRECGREVHLCTVPPANGIDMSGEALAVNCVSYHSHYEAFGSISGGCGHRHPMIWGALLCAEAHSCAIKQPSDRWPYRVNTDGTRDQCTAFDVSWARDQIEHIRKDITMELKDQTL